MYVIILTIISTIIIYYIFHSSNETFLVLPDEHRFYSSLTEKNIRLRPNKRIYYSYDDIRVPNVITEKINSAFSFALQRFPLSFVIKPQIVYASKDVEGGMPHTLDNRIIFPLHKSLFSKTKEESIQTITHELCHIHQRQHPKLWKTLYKKLGFIKLNSSNLPKLLLHSDVVSNPDAGTPGMPQLGWWSYRGQIGVLVFRNNATTIANHHSVVIPVSAEGSSSGINYLKDRFGDLCSQYDHPNEITACIIADHWSSVMKPNIIKRSKDDPIRIIREWILENTIS
jgi:hypothetical protein